MDASWADLGSDLRSRLWGAVVSTPAWALDPPSQSVSDPAPLHPASPASSRATDDLRAAILRTSEAIDRLNVNAVAACVRADELREAALATGAAEAAVAAAFDELMLDISQAASRKAAALDTELVELDAALEQADAAIASFMHAVSNASDDELLETRDTLLGRIDVIFEHLRGAPRGATEEPTLAVAPLPVPSGGGAGLQLGVLVTRLASPTAVELRLPPGRRVRPGGSVEVHVLLPRRPDRDSSVAPADGPGGDSHPLGLGGYSRADAVTSLLQRLEVRASLVTVAGRRTYLPPSFARCRKSASSWALSVAGEVWQDGVTASIAVPELTSEGSILTIECATVACEPVGVFPSPLPLQMLVYEQVGIATPLMLPGVASDYQTPCITTDGRIIIPAECVCWVLNRSGLRQCELSVSNGWRGGAAAHVDICGSDTLIVRDGGEVRALDLRVYEDGRTAACGAGVDEAATLSHTDVAGPKGVLWRYAFNRGGGPGSVVALPEAGVVGFVDKHSNAVLALRTADGAVLRTVALEGSPIYAAPGPPSSGAAFVSKETDGSVWHVGLTGPPLDPVLVYEYSISEQHTGSSPLAMMPPAAGRAEWHLVIAKYSTLLITVLAVSSRSVVYSGVVRLPGGADLAAPVASSGSYGIGVLGLAADPSGSALLMTLVGGNAVALPWPLDGMPELS